MEKIMEKCTMIIEIYGPNEKKLYESREGLTAQLKNETNEELKRILLKKIESINDCGELYNLF
jgi:hypothetical protein